MDPTAADLADVFLHGISDGDLDAAFAVIAADARFALPAAGLPSIDAAGAREFLAHTLAAFPDLRFVVRRWFVAGEGTVVAEMTFGGTQAGDYLGIVNQEKHIDIDQVWIIRVRDGHVANVRAMWDQNQLYRRLAVKRLDAVAIVGSAKGVVS